MGEALTRASGPADGVPGAADKGTRSASTGKMKRASTANSWATRAAAAADEEAAQEHELPIWACKIQYDGDVFGFAVVLFTPPLSHLLFTPSLHTLFPSDGRSTRTKWTIYI